MTLGLKLDHNVLVPPNPSWASAFDAERGRIATALGDVAKGIEHYGSTAVGGLRAKPIIDILVGINPIADWERCRAPLEAAGYRYFPDAGVQDHRVFTRFQADGQRTHLLHIVQFQSDQWRRNLAFRDGLRRDAGLRAAYEAQKESAAARAPSDRLAYNALKSGFIRAVMAGIPPVPPDR